MPETRIEGLQLETLTADLQKDVPQTLTEVTVTWAPQGLLPLT